MIRSSIDYHTSLSMDGQKYIKSTDSSYRKVGTQSFLFSRKLGGFKNTPQDVVYRHSLDEVNGLWKGELECVIDGSRTLLVKVKLIPANNLF